MKRFFIELGKLIRFRLTGILRYTRSVKYRPIYVDKKDNVRYFKDKTQKGVAFASLKGARLFHDADQRKNARGERHVVKEVIITKLYKW